MRFIFAAAFVLIVSAVPVSTAWAGWACGAVSSDGTTGRAWSEPDEAVARKDALKYCSDGDHPSCRIISCAENIDTQAQAHAVWPGTGTVGKCFGSGPCDLGKE